MAIEPLRNAVEKENVLAMNGGENSCVLRGSLEDSWASSKVRELFTGRWDEVIYCSVQCLLPRGGEDFGVSPGLLGSPRPRDAGEEKFPFCLDGSSWGGVIPDTHELVFKDWFILLLPPNKTSFSSSEQY